MSFLDWLTWWRITVMAGAGAVIVGLIVYVFVPVQYSASSTFLVKEGAASSLVLPAEMMMPGARPTTTSQLYMEMVLNSRNLRSALIQAHQLESRLGLSPQKAQEWLREATDISAIGKRPMRDGVGTTTTVTVDSTNRLSQWRGQPKPFTHEEAKQLCAQLANDYVASLSDYLVKVNIKNAQANQQFIEGRLKEVRVSLAETEDRLQRMRTQYLFLEPANKFQVLVDTASTASKEFATGEVRTKQLASSLASSRTRLSREDADRITTQVQQRNQNFAVLEQELTNLQTEYQTELAKGKSPRHPDVVVIQSAIDEIKQQRTQLPQQVLQQVTVQANPLYDKLLLDVVTAEVQLAGEQARQRQLKQQVDQAENALRSLPPVAREYTKIQEKYKIQTELLASLSRQLELANIEVNRDSVSSFDIMDEAEPPEKKAGPSTVINTVLAFFVLFMILALGWAARHGLFFDYAGDH
jgi:uncharacterized protein involved in exopolysaccharide biosynthesis